MAMRLTSRNTAMMMPTRRTIITIEAPRSRRRSGLVVVMAIFGLAVIGTAGAFGYRAMFGGSVLPTLPPIIKASNGPNKVAPAYADSQASNANDSRPAGAATTGSTESLVSREEQPVTIEPPRATPRVVSTIPIITGQGSGQGLPSGLSAPAQACTQPGGLRPHSVRGRFPLAAAAAMVAAPPPRRQLRRCRRRAPGFLGTEENPHRHHPRRSIRQCGRCTGFDGSGRASCRAVADPCRRCPADRSAAFRAECAHVDCSGQPSWCAGAAANADGSATRECADGGRQHGRHPGCWPLAVVVMPFRSRLSAAKAMPRRAFRSLQAKYPNQLGGRAPIIRRADLGEKGTFYRALVGPFASAEEAAGLCSGLKAAGGNCIVQRH